MILYGCGDFLNDYEGIRGREEYCSDLGLMYFPEIQKGKLINLTLTPTQIRKMRVNHAGKQGVNWLQETLNREGEQFGTHSVAKNERELQLKWSSYPY